MKSNQANRDISTTEIKHDTSLNIGLADLDEEMLDNLRKVNEVHGKHDIIEASIDQLNAEIARIEAKYISDLHREQSEESISEIQNPSSDMLDNNELNLSKDKQYEVLVGSMKEAAKKLIALRIKLATELRNNIEEDHLNKDVSGAISSSEVVGGSHVQTMVLKLMKILTDIDSYRTLKAKIFQENEKDLERTTDDLQYLLYKLGQYDRLGTSENNGHRYWMKDIKLQMNQYQPSEVLDKPVNTEDRSYHQTHCGLLTDLCGGWNLMCCDDDSTSWKGQTVPLCCVFMEDYKAGMCLPNAYVRDICML